MFLAWPAGHRTLIERPEKRVSGRNYNRLSQKWLREIFCYESFSNIELPKVPTRLELGQPQAAVNAKVDGQFACDQTPWDVMANYSTTSDSGLLDLLRQRGPLGIAALAAATKVTPTAVRQRLNRLMQQGLIERNAAAAQRGRPSHRYSLTTKGQRSPGTNFSDLAVVLWNEIRAVKDTEVRRGLFKRLATNMAALYQRQVHGDTLEQRMQSVAAIFSERQVPLVVEHATTNESVETQSGPTVFEDGTSSAPPRRKGSLPVLTALACPYPELAEQDRGICAMERMLFSEMLGRDVRLSECRLDGDSCCRFTATDSSCTS